MSKQNHLFIIDPLEKLDLELDSSVRLAHALSNLGHQVFFSCLSDLFWICPEISQDGAKRAKSQGIKSQKSQDGASCKATKILFEGGDPSSAASGRAQLLKLSEFSAIHMRKDPPFDMTYISALWFLESAPKKVKIFNCPEGIRSVNEKLSILRFPEDIRPGLASCNPEQILSFIKNRLNGDAIIKPLDQYSGKGIFRVDLTTESENEAFERIKKELSIGIPYRLVQEFDSRIYDGEVRVFVVGGEPLAWCLKKPSSGGFMANSSFGSTRHHHEPTAVERERVLRVSAELLKDGISVVGYDLIGGYISEINVTSPRLLAATDDLSMYFEKFATWVENESK